MARITSKPIVTTPQLIGNPPPAREGKIHVVQKGETLWSIAEQKLGEGTRWKELATLNPQIEDPTRIWPGDKVLVEATDEPIPAPPDATITPTIAPSTTAAPAAVVGPTVTPTKPLTDQEIEAQTGLGKSNVVADPELPAEQKQEKGKGVLGFMRKQLDKHNIPLDQKFKTELGETEVTAGVKKGKLSGDGIKQAEVFVAMKRMCGGVEVKPDGSMKIVDNKIEEVKAACAVVAKNADGNVTYGADGNVKFTGGKFADANFNADFKAVLENTEITTAGKVHFNAEGFDSARLRNVVKQTFGDRATSLTTVTSETEVVFDDSGLDLRKVGARMSRQMGDVELTTSALYDGAFHGGVGRTFGNDAIAGDGMISVKGFDGDSIKKVQLDVGVGSTAEEGASYDASGMLAISSELVEAGAEGTLDLEKATIRLDGSIKLGETDGAKDGRYFVDTVRARDGAVEVYIPTGTVNFTRGKSLAREDRLKLSVPEVQKAALAERSDELSLALRHGKVEPLREGIAGLTIERTASTELGNTLKAGFSKQLGVDALVGAGVSAEFGRSLKETDVVSMSIHYSEQDPQIAEVRVSKLDVEQMARSFALKVGPSINKELITQALGEHLKDGSPLVQKLSGKAAPAVIKQLEKFVKQARLSLSSSSASRQMGYEEMRFSGFDLRDPSDLAAFEGLVVSGDPELALQGNKLSFERVRTEEQKTNDLVLELLSKKYAVNHTSWGTQNAQTYHLGDGSTVEIRGTAAGVSQEKEGWFQDHRFDARAMVVSRNGQNISSLTSIRYHADDDRVTVGDSRRVQRAADAMGLDIVDRETGETRSFIGIGKNYGKGKIDMSLVLTSEGNRAVITREPRDAQLSTMQAASQIRGTTVPPSEFFDDALPTSFQAVALATRADLDTSDLIHLPDTFDQEFPDASRVQVAELAKHWELATSEKGLKKAMKELRNQNRNKRTEPWAADFFSHMDDAQLKELIKQTAASRMLVEHRLLEQDPFADDIGGEDFGEDSAQDIAHDYKRLTGRKLSDDAWIVQQGLRTRDLYERPALARARGGGSELTIEQSERLVADTFREVAEEYLPGSSFLGLGGSSDDEEALALYAGLVRGLSPEEAMVSVSIDAKRLKFSALSDSSDAELVDKLKQERTVEAAMQEALGEVGHKTPAPLIEAPD